MPNLEAVVIDSVDGIARQPLSRLLQSSVGLRADGCERRLQDPEPLVATGRFREAIIPITHQIVDRLVAVI